MNLLRTLAGLAFAAGAGAAAAQAITFFEHEGFGGRRFDEVNAIANFEQYGFNDRATSVVVHYGQWQLCTDADFRGHCVTLNPGRYANLGTLGIANRVSSARQIGGGQAAGPAPAPAPGGQLVMYDRYDFGGSNFPINGTIENLDNTRWNDRAASLVVHSGTWELCDDANFQGRCQTYGPGRYANLGGQAGRVSSVRQISGGGGGGGGTGYPDGWGNRARVVLYEGPNMTGRRYVIDNDYVQNLDGTGFNDRAASLRVERGTWLFCSDADFRGNCNTFGPGDYPNLPSGLSNQISSGRRVSDSNPHGNNPNPGGSGNPR